MFVFGYDVIVVVRNSRIKYNINNLNPLYSFYSNVCYSDTRNYRTQEKSCHNPVILETEAQIFGYVVQNGVKISTVQSKRFKFTLIICSYHDHCHTTLETNKCQTTNKFE